MPMQLEIMCSRSKHRVNVASALMAMVQFGHGDIIEAARHARVVAFARTGVDVPYSRKSLHIGFAIGRYDRGTMLVGKVVCEAQAKSFAMKAVIGPDSNVV